MASDSFDESHSSDFSSVYEVILQIPEEAATIDETYNLTQVISKRFIIVQRQNTNQLLEMKEFALWAIF